MISKSNFNIAVCEWIESKTNDLKVCDITDQHINELYSKVVARERMQHPGIE